jgi:hypothetical protein
MSSLGEGVRIVNVSTGSACSSGFPPLPQPRERERLTVLQVNVVRLLRWLGTLIRIFENTIGDLEPILGEEIPKLEKVLMNGVLTDVQTRAMAEQCLDAIDTKRKTQSSSKRSQSAG